MTIPDTLHFDFNDICKDCPIIELEVEKNVLWYDDEALPQYFLSCSYQPVCKKIMTRLSYKAQKLQQV